MTNDIQAAIAAIIAAGEQERSRYHLTLGKLISLLADAGEDDVVSFDVGGYPEYFYSYRGYYSDLALSAQSREQTAGRLLGWAKDALGATFAGYKGGDYVMTAATPLWMAEYGRCGRAIVGYSKTDGAIVLLTKDMED